MYKEEEIKKYTLIKYSEHDAVFLRVCSFGPHIGDNDDD